MPADTAQRDADAEAGEIHTEAAAAAEAEATGGHDRDDAGFPLPLMEAPPFQTILVLNADGALTLRDPSRERRGSGYGFHSLAEVTNQRDTTSAAGAPAPSTLSPRVPKFDHRNHPKWIADSSADVQWWCSDRNRTSSVRLCKDAWFSVFRHLSLPEVAMHHRINKELGDAARAAMRRVETLDLWRNDRVWRSNLLEAVLRGGCGSLTELHATGAIDTIGKVVQAASNIELIMGLAPNLLSKHLKRDVPTLTRLSLWVDATFSDDLSVVADRFQNLRTLQLTATAGITVYDQQVGKVFEQCTQLETVQLRSIHCTEDIAETFRALQNLKSLRLEDARLTDPVLTVLIDSLAQGTTTLERLSIKHNSISPSGIALIGRCANLRKSLTGFEISHAGDIYSGTFHMVCDRGFLPQLQHLRVAPRLRGVFQRKMAMTRPGVQVGSHALL